jgi:hypothetical protein
MTKKETETSIDCKGKQLWNNIKDLPLDIFALQNQRVKDFAQVDEGMFNAFPDDVCLVLKAQAVLPALEEALMQAQGRNMIKIGKDERFEFSRISKYTVLKIVPKDAY